MRGLKLLEFPHSSLVDLPAKLRQLADDVEKGEYGEARTCIVVLDAATLEVFGFGAEADGTVAHYLLACAQRIIEQPTLNR